VIDFEYDDIDASLADSVRAMCESRLAASHARETGVSPEFWRQLGSLGVLALGTPGGGGGVTTIAAAMESLGHADAPGPLVETLVAMQLLDEERASSVGDGSQMATVAVTQPVAWLPDADVVVEIDGGIAHLVTVKGDVEPVASLVGDPWGSAVFERRSQLGDATRALAVGDVATAAYMVGEAEQLLAAAAAYATDRVQFKVPIASFQAVAHPLADCFLRVAAARTVTRGAAYALDTAAPNAFASAATARRSATRAALDTAFRAHQTYGAMGFTVEGPIGARSARIRQASLAVIVPGAIDRILAARGL
jgi:alkylation response protein AidB-like acyl-CoA dehydrogenase